MRKSAQREDIYTKNFHQHISDILYIYMYEKTRYAIYMQVIRKHAFHEDIYTKTFQYV